MSRNLTSMRASSRAPVALRRPPRHTACRFSVASPGGGRPAPAPVRVGLVRATKPGSSPVPTGWLSTATAMSTWLTPTTTACRSSMRMADSSPSGAPYGSDDSQFLLPFDVVVDSSGDVYVSDYHNHCIRKFRDSGGDVYGCILTIGTPGTYGAGEGVFNLPWGLAVDDDDNLYVADNYNHRIQKFSSNGDFVTKWGIADADDNSAGGGSRIRRRWPSILPATSTLRTTTTTASRSSCGILTSAMQASTNSSRSGRSAAGDSTGWRWTHRTTSIVT